MNTLFKQLSLLEKAYECYRTCREEERCALANKTCTIIEWILDSSMKYSTFSYKHNDVFKLYLQYCNMDKI